MVTEDELLLGWQRENYRKPRPGQSKLLVSFEDEKPASECAASIMVRCRRAYAEECKPETDEQKALIGMLWSGLSISEIESTMRPRYASLCELLDIIMACHPKEEAPV